MTCSHIAACGADAGCSDHATWVATDGAAGTCACDQGCSGDGFVRATDSAAPYMQIAIAPLGDTCALRVDGSFWCWGDYGYLVRGRIRHQRAGTRFDARSVDLSARWACYSIRRPEKTIHSVLEICSAGCGHGAGRRTGLALCRELARRNGGDLRYAPSGEGARFVLTLPV